MLLDNAGASAEACGEQSKHGTGRSTGEATLSPLSGRWGLAVLLAVVVSIAATVFGIGFAPESHHEDATETAETAGEHAEEEGAGHAEEEKAGASTGAIASAILISVAAVLLVPFAATRGGGPAVAALLSVGAAVIHFAVIAEHFDEWWLTGLFFLALAIFQLAWALLVLRVPSRPLYLAGAVANALVVVLWIVSRTTGVPVGPGAGEAEPVALPDTLATAFEVVLAVVLVALLSEQTAPGTRRRVDRSAASWACAVAVAALTALALVSIA